MKTKVLSIHQLHDETVSETRISFLFPSGVSDSFRHVIRGSSSCVSRFNFSSSGLFCVLLSPLTSDVHWGFFFFRDRSPFSNGLLLLLTDGCFHVSVSCRVTVLLGVNLRYLLVFPVCWLRPVRFPLKFFSSVTLLFRFLVMYFNVNRPLCLVH